MELSSSNIKKDFIFSKTEVSNPKNKKVQEGTSRAQKNQPRKNFLYFGK